LEEQAGFFEFGCFGRFSLLLELARDGGVEGQRFFRRLRE
jgi:hypothetical protein